MNAVIMHNYIDSYKYRYSYVYRYTYEFFHILCDSFPRKPFCYSSKSLLKSQMPRSDISMARSNNFVLFFFVFYVSNKNIFL